MEEKNIKIGMGATLYVGSDRYPYVVIDIKRNGKQVILQECQTKPGVNFDYYNNQNWDITPDPTGKIITANKARRNGNFYNEGRTPVSFGKASMYQDPSF